VPTEENISVDVCVAVPTRQKSARAPVNSPRNINTIDFLTTRSRNLEASLDQLQKKATATTAELAAARKQGEEGTARLNALEAQMSKVFPPEPNTV
jgi:outer membrane murein-binding lipoprotein Lpp